MDSLEQELYEANRETIQENSKLTPAQQQQVQDIIAKEVNVLKTFAAEQKAKIDFMAGKTDPDKPNYREMCEVGAQLVDNSPNFKAGLMAADNKAEFLYELGKREVAYQASQQQRPQQPPQPMIPKPEAGTSPYASTINPASIPWGSLTDEQFIEQAAAFGIKL